MSKTIEKVGDAIDRAKRAAEATSLAAQQQTRAAQEAAARKVRALTVFADLTEQLEKAQAKFDLAKVSLKTLLSSENLKASLEGAAAALIHRGEHGITEFSLLTELEWLAEHAQEVTAIMRDKTLGAVERQMATLRKDFGDVLGEHNL